MSQKEVLLEEYARWLRTRNFAMRTCVLYNSCVDNFWEYCENNQNQPGWKKKKAVQHYLSYRRVDCGVSFSSVNCDYSALKLFYENILDRDWDVEKMKRPRKTKQLPKYITPEQFSQLLSVIKNLKHRMFMLLCYSTGLRITEARLLKWESVDFQGGRIRVNKGKGSKDRIVILHETLKEALKMYRHWVRYKQEYVFETKKGVPIGASSVNKIIVSARQKANLPNWVTCHVLRHSFASTALRNGTDVLTLQKLLGHKDLSTTSIYLHLDDKHLQNSYDTLQNSAIQLQLNQNQNTQLAK